MKRIVLLSIVTLSAGILAHAQQPARAAGSRQEAGSNSAISAVNRAAIRILEHQANDGAITMDKPVSTNSRVVPYFANFAAQGLVAAFRETREPRFLDAAKQWAVWYESHMNPDGTVCDYTGGPGAWKSTGDYDSTDSYAATYLELVLAVQRAKNVPEWLPARHSKVRQALAAIQLTLQKNGLTTAKPAYPVIYLMDNVETARGLRAASEIAAELGELNLREETRSLALKMEAATSQKLWNEAKRNYRVGLKINEAPLNDTGRWYPDIMANLMAIGWLPPHSRHVLLLQDLLRTKAADKPASARTENDLTRLVWWGIAAQGAHQTNLLADVRSQLSNFDATVQRISNPAVLGHICRLLARAESPRETPIEHIRTAYDVIIAGAGTGGFGAAVQAARLGMTVLLVEETDWIGGQMTAAAVTSMDEGPTEKGRPYVLVRERGIYHEFSEAVFAHYRDRGMDANRAYWNARLCMEPREGQHLLYQMLDEARTHTPALHVLLRTKVSRVSKAGDRVSGATLEITTPQGKVGRDIASRILIDATEWGDVLPLTGARYRTGNCVNGAVDPERAIQDITWAAVIKEYPGSMPGDLLLKQPPPGYDAREDHFSKTLVPGEKVDPGEKPWGFATFIGYRGMPNSDQPTAPGITRTHMNYNNDYPIKIADLEDRDAREHTCRQAQLRTLQLLYYAQHEVGKTNWSVATDEGYDTPYNRDRIDRWVAEQPEMAPFRTILYHFPVMAYARESRRMIGIHTLVAGEIERKPRSPRMFETAIALGDYAVDLHGSKIPRLLELDLDKVQDIPTKTFGERGQGPFAIPFECLIPETLDGFLPAEKNFSQSRLANGATRLQPSTMLIGQAAGAIAGLSIKHNLQPRQLDPVLVQRLLLANGDTLQIVPFRDVAKSGPEWPAIQLVTVRGIMQLREARFEPAAPLSADDLRLATSKLFNKDIEQKEPITRNDLARLLAPLMAEAKVTLIPNATYDPTPVTRLESAQVFASFLEARAMATLTGQEQTLGWTTIRKPTPLTHNDMAPSLEADVRKLVRAGLIVSPQYWIENAVEGKTCDGKNVRELIARTAKIFDPAVQEADMFNVCATAGVFNSSDYWSKSAVEGGQCAGAFVGTVIRRIAERLPTDKQ